MTDITLDRLPHSKSAPASYLTEGHTIASWLLTTDHKRIAILYALAITFFFFIGGLAISVVRLELLSPHGLMLTDEEYNRLFTLHGIVMVWFFLVPSIPTTFGNFLLPMMIGAKDVAFPRINLMSWYIFMIAGFMALYTVIAGGVDTGWTFYTPLSTFYANSNVIAAAAAVFIAGFSSIATGVNFIATTHLLRAPGMTWTRLPLFVWSIYATSLVMVLATPVLAMSLLLIIAERWLGLPIFNPTEGGDPLLFQHLFWFYSHPAVYIMILPAMGVASEVLACFARRRVFGYVAMIISMMTIALIGFMVWGHHMFVAGQSPYANLIFSFLSFIVAVPSAIKVFNWTATLYRGSITLKAPLLYIQFRRAVHHRGPDRIVSRLGAGRYPRAFDLFRHRSFPLHHGRRDGVGVFCGATFLVAEDHRPHVSRRLGALRSDDDVPRLHRHLHAAVHHGLRRHAAALPRLP